MIQRRKTRVLVVDDSAIVRKLVTDILRQDNSIEVVGTAIDPYVARDKILELDPDVLTLDIEMPRMDGLTFLKILMKHRPMPVIIMSSLTQTGSRYAMEALSAGAVDIVAKPNGSYSVGDIAEELIGKVKAAAASRMSTLKRDEATQAVVPRRAAPPRVQRASFDPRQLVLLGASTGGTEALKTVLQGLPTAMPGICIVQHIPAYFSKAFADRLNTVCDIEVREAVDGDIVYPGLALIAPGDFHMVLRRQGGQYTVQLTRGAKVWHQRPAVDILFESAAAIPGLQAVAGILTGMGRDGADGLLKLKQAGARTFAQDEKSSVVYGMPRVAYEIGAADTVLPLDEVSDFLVESVHCPVLR